MTPEQTAEKIAKEVIKLEKKYGVQLGVWMDWRDLYCNLDVLKTHPEINELHFGLQIRFENEPNNKD
jgi:isoleucyl-tRNA synthetase